MNPLLPNAPGRDYPTAFGLGIRVSRLAYDWRAQPDSVWLGI